VNGLRGLASASGDSAGIDLAMLAGVKSELGDPSEGRAREKLRRRILSLQDALTSIERCRKPVIAAVNGACIGASPYAAARRCSCTHATIRWPMA
jgi:enoyl-CoA hydratase